MDNLKFMFATRKRFIGALFPGVEELVLLHDCGSGLYIEVSYYANNRKLKWVAALVSEATLTNEKYVLYPNVVCDR